MFVAPIKNADEDIVLYLQRIKGRTETIRVSPKLTGKELSTCIEQKFNISLANAWLTCQAKAIEPLLSLSSSNIIFESNIIITFRGLGAGNKCGGFKVV